MRRERTWSLGRAVVAMTENGKTDSVSIEVEFIYDPDSENWAYRIPSLHVTGGAETEEEAFRMARESIIYALTDPEHSPGATKRGYFPAELKAGKLVTA